MVERRRERARALGYLRVGAQGGCSTTEMRALLAAFEESYRAVAAVELAAHRAVVAMEWDRRYGPPPRYLPPLWMLRDVEPTRLRVSDERLVVSRVTLASPGFWEFFGKLNPLEVLRQYLNDRHEREKDRDYRSDAEREQLALENAMRRLDVVERLRRLEGEFGPDLYSTEAWRLAWEADLSAPLRRLADFDRQELIDGRTAKTGPGQLPPGEE